MDSELTKATKALVQYTTWSTDQAAIALRKKIDDLQQAKATLITLKKDS